MCMSVLWDIVYTLPHFDGLVQDTRNSSALAMELRLPCINPLISSQILKTGFHSLPLFIRILFCDVPP